jgi:hypothetical protein
MRTLAPCRILIHPQYPRFGELFHKHFFRLLYRRPLILDFHPPAFGTALGRRLFMAALMALHRRIGLMKPQVDGTVRAGVRISAALAQ